MSGSNSELVNALSGGGLLGAIAHPATMAPNLLAAYGQGQQTAAEVWQNRQNQARQLAGQAFQHSIDPATGQPNAAALNQGLAAAGPAAAPAALQTATAGQALDADTWRQHMTRLTALSSATAQLSAQYHNNVPQDAINAAIDDEVRRKVITPEDGERAKSSFGADPTQNGQVLLRQQIQNLQAQQALAVGQPNPQQAALGNRTEVWDSNPITNPGSPGMVGTVGTPGFAPGEAAARVPIGVVPAGQPNAGAPVYGTPGQFQAAATGAAPTPGTTVPGRLGAAPTASGAQPGPLGTGRPPASSPLRNLPAGGAPGAPGGPGVVSELGPAATAAASARGTAAAAAFASIADQGTQARQQTAVLGNMLADADQFATGPGTHGTKAFKAAMVAWAPKLSAALGVSPESIAANESFDKLTAQILQGQGAGSDARLAVNEAGTPHSGLTPAGVRLIVHQLQGNADFLAARASQAQAWHDQSDRDGFESAIGQKLDPRAFQFARMSGPEKLSYDKSLGKEDRDAVTAAYVWAEKRGLIGGAGARR